MGMIQKNKKKTKNKVFNDLLIPILFVICIMPLIVYLAEYDCGYSKYDWYSSDGIVQDLYSYFRSYIFEVVAILSAFIVALKIFITKGNNKSSKIFIPVAGYGLFVVISTLVSVNQSASMTGNFASFENIMVLLGYGIMGFYTYQIMDSERDFETVKNGIIFISVIMIIIGGFQLFNHELLDYEWIQRLIMNKDYESVYVGNISHLFDENNIFLTLYNPNYAGQFLAMLSCLFIVLFITENIRKKKIMYGVFSVLLLILLWCTYSRGALVALAAGLVFYAIFMRAGKKRQNEGRTSDRAVNVQISESANKKKCNRSVLVIIAAVILVCVLFVVVDWANGFHFAKRMIDSPVNDTITDFQTGSDGVTVYYKDGTTELLTSDTDEITYQAPDSDFVWYFYKEDDGWKFYNNVGNMVDISVVDKADFHGLEFLGSARGYIWSRVVPLLKKYIFAGSGPDTFPEVFPQKDYVGKLYYSKLNLIIEKAHNMYLGTWVQTGLLSLVGLIIFYVWFISHCVRSYSTIAVDRNTMKHRLGIAALCACICFLAGGLFNDSTIYTTPLFWVFAGVTLAGCDRIV
jgi:hypothetical protein